MRPPVAVAQASGFTVWACNCAYIQEEHLSQETVKEKEA